MEITPDLSVETLLEHSPETKEVLVQYFGVGVTMPGQTWTAEPLSKATLIRGVDVRALLDDLRRVVSDGPAVL